MPPMIDLLCPVLDLLELRDPVAWLGKIVEANGDRLTTTTVAKLGPCASCWCLNDLHLRTMIMANQPCISHSSSHLISFDAICLFDWFASLFLLATLLFWATTVSSAGLPYPMKRSEILVGGGLWPAVAIKLNSRLERERGQLDMLGKKVFFTL